MPTSRIKLTARSLRRSLRASLSGMSTCTSPRRSAIRLHRRVQRASRVLEYQRGRPVAAHATLGAERAHLDPPRRTVPERQTSRVQQVQDCRHVIDLPAPDSPTKASARPGSSENETPSTRVNGWRSSSGSRDFDLDDRLIRTGCCHRILEVRHGTVIDRTRVVGGARRRSGSAT